MTGRSKSRVGLDIGSHFVKLVEISGTSEKPVLVSFGLKDIRNSPKGVVVEAIRALASENKVPFKNCCISLSGSSLVARILSLPKMTDEELKNAVKFETEKFIPFDINECVLDFHVQSDGIKGKEGLDVLLAAAKKELVMQKVKIAEEAGFSVNIVDVDSFAISNAFWKNFPPVKSSKVTALLNIGSVCTNLVVIKGDIIAFVRDMPIGSSEMAAGKNDESAGFAKDVLARLLDEVKLSFGYYENQSGRGIDDIYISGGGVYLPELEDAFSGILGSKVNGWNPFQFLKIDSSRIDIAALDKTRSSFAVAVGLALR
ncbi:MAG: pilus assembly protein PilM [Candidatus Omnitrophica bacterium]|nr:pilus assembly protein PilM [Candidatus Omnitrophota bacterium]